MALPTKVNIGTAPGNGTGDPARTAFDKLNARDEYLDANKAEKSEITALELELATKETPAGAQAKADAAESNSNAYTDSLLQGRKWKDAADLATTANITLSGEQTIDGTLTAVSRVLVKNQTNAAENGIYTTDAGAWTRTADADSGTELEAATLKVLGGATNLNKIYTCNSSAITLGTTDVVFIHIGEAQDHNSTSGKQGGTAGEYYHLTLEQVEKLDGVEENATADMTGAEIKTAYENQPNTNAFTDSHKTTVESIPASIEPAFSKNTAFNKNFGETAGTVAEGNDERILNGQTAFDYGDHATAGYALDTTVVKSVSVNGGAAQTPDPSGKVDLTISAANETRVTSNITTTYNLDWSNAVFVLTLTADTVLTDINLPTGTNTKVIELIVTGDFALTLPTYWTAKPSNDAYNGLVENHIVVSCINGNTGVEKVIYSLENLA